MPRLAKPQMGWIASAVESALVIVAGVATASAVLSAIIAGVFLLMNGAMTVILTRWLDRRDRDDARRAAEKKQMAKAQARSSRKGRSG